MDKLCEKFKFKQYKSSANGLVEAFNKTLCNLLKKIVSKSKRDWQREDWRSVMGVSNDS